MKVYPKDILALIIVLGGGFLLYSGFNGWIQAVLAMIIAYYFARRENINGIK